MSGCSKKKVWFSWSCWQLSLREASAARSVKAKLTKMVHIRRPSCRLLLCTSNTCFSIRCVDSLILHTVRIVLLIIRTLSGGKKNRSKGRDRIDSLHSGHKKPSKISLACNGGALVRSPSTFLPVLTAAHRSTLSRVYAFYYSFTCVSFLFYYVFLLVHTGNLLQFKSAGAVENCKLKNTKEHRMCMRWLCHAPSRKSTVRPAL